MKHGILLLFLVTIYFTGCNRIATIPYIDKSFEETRAFTKGNILVVSTGKLERSWEWTGKGFVTMEIKNEEGQVLATGSGRNADWDLGNIGEGKLVSLKAFENNDEDFTSNHLAVEAEIYYDSLHVKYVIWAYPEASGLRTQLWLKTPEGIKQKGEKVQPGISESLTLSSSPERVTAFGYHSGLKADYKPYEILTEEIISENSSSVITSGLIAQNKENGLIMLKESHKHTHMTNELETGGFERKGNKIFVTGLGLKPHDFVDEKFKFCWANWLILYNGFEIDAQLALKQFDRSRYPVHPKRDVFIMANTWGSEDKPDQCGYKAREENVLREINACADLGIDLLQIDDGWQIRQGENSWLPAASGPTRPYGDGQLPLLLDGSLMPENYRIYPNGFGKVKQAAKSAGIRLGLWHAWNAPIQAIKTNYDNGDFKAFKLDFARLDRKEELDHLYFKGRELIKHSGYSAVVNWDVTEHPARMGFYFGRECGNIYLANRKAYTIRPAVQYDPWQVLRDAWELADYMNLNKVQVTYQNKDLTPSEAITDALKYPHGYNFAITLMSSPIFFTEIQLLTPEAQAELKPIIAKYKAERDEIYKGYVFAIGSKPDNESWTGFQNYNPETGDGYLTVFRELNNSETSALITLHFLKPGTEVQLTDILTNKSWQVVLNEKSELKFEMSTSPGFLFLKYNK